MGQYVKPKVTLVAWTTNPLEAMVSQVDNMFGNMTHDLSTITPERCTEVLDEIKKTGLKGALEIIDLTFQIEDVPRSFTHQLVRNRIGATYHQESLRFTERVGGFNYDIGRSIRRNPEARELTEALMAHIANEYDALKEHEGVETEDVRGVLPISVCTKIGFKVNFKTLMHMSHVRLCIQSQNHWYEVMRQMKKEVAEKVSPELAELLQPICDAEGKCAFKSKFDRTCPKAINLKL